ncbi:hypothetical protein EVAR_88594_1 [Eumeta japonica]|uniref:Uncharacterized protein n=1 Tax=Eumeta variegata TaxID=151549 RepID=A0A4C1Y6B3_EUMVA|nr:hypothetical protein EVAR_88594_1 [Eumeta japonica]
MSLRTSAQRIVHVYRRWPVDGSRPLPEAREGRPARASTAASHSPAVHIDGARCKSTDQREATLRIEWQQGVRRDNLEHQRGSAISASRSTDLSKVDITRDGTSTPTAARRVPSEVLSPKDQILSTRNGATCLMRLMHIAEAGEICKDSMKNIDVGLGVSDTENIDRPPQGITISMFLPSFCRLQWTVSWLTEVRQQPSPISDFVPFVRSSSRPYREGVIPILQRDRL